MKTAVINVMGRIQEVGYRARVIGLASGSNIKGYVKNLPDNNVEIVAQAPEEILKEFIEDINIQDPFIHVDKIKVTYSDKFEGFTDFNKIVGSNETDSRLDKAVTELKGIKEELKVVVTALKETNKSIQNMNQNMQEGFSKLDQNMHDNHVELVNKMNHNHMELINKMDHNHGELVSEIHGLREDNNEKVMSEIQEVKSILKAYLKLS